MANLETAVFGGGCFWCLEAVFQRVTGVSTVESGYMGGELEQPTYEQVCTGRSGHAEVVRVSFDPAVIRYRDLLDVFFGIHDPTTPDRQGNDVGPQYRSVIFYNSDDQRRHAEQAISELTAAHAFPERIVTAVEPAGTFWPAEGYHRDYFANNPNQPYCRFVVEPKVRKFLHKFQDRVRTA